MKIGLVRHFKVKRGYPNKVVSSDDLMKWLDEYEASEVEECEIDVGGIEWKKCYSSDLTRAKITAEKAFSGNIIYLEELREVPLTPFFKKNVRLPLFLHLIFIRIAWLLNHPTQKESKQNVLKRIHKVLDEVLETGEDVLIVGHGGIMIFMRKELIRRGFKGPKFKRPENAKLYIFEK